MRVGIAERLSWGRSERNGALHARTDQWRLSRRQINERTSKGIGSWEGQDQRVLPVCTMPSPLCTAWAGSQISGPLHRMGAWMMLEYNAQKLTHTQTHTHSTPQLYLSFLRFFHHWAFEDESAAPSLPACGSSRWLSLITPCWICPPLVWICQPGFGLKVDSNLSCFFVSPVGTAVFLRLGILWSAWLYCLWMVRIFCLTHLLELNTWNFTYNDERVFHIAFGECVILLH